MYQSRANYWRDHKWRYKGKEKRKMDSFVVRNIKFHVKLGHPIEIPEKIHSHMVRHSNFVVIRFHPLVYVVFPSSGHVNVSGVKDFSGIKDAISQLNSHLHCDIQEEHIKVDNSTVSGKLSVKTPIDFISLIRSTNKKWFNISIRPHFFPSMVLRPKVKKSLGTCMVFSTGKFIIVGAKSEKVVKDTYSHLLELMHTIEST